MSPEPVTLRAFAALSCALVAFSVVAMADDERVFVPAEANMPMYQIGPIQIDASRKRQATPEVIVQWRLVRPGVGSPTVRAVSGDRNLILILAGVSGQRSGTLRFDYEGSTREPAVAAVWFEINRVRMPSSLVSNVSKLGNVDPKRLPRLAGEIEIDKFVEKQKHLPPTVLPAGFVPLLRSHPMAAGMTGKAAHENKWFDAEVLAVDARGWLTLKFDDPDGTIRLLPTLPTGKTGFFIVQPKTLSAVKRNPRGFRPSVAVLPGTIAEIPEGYLPLSAARLPAGLPVKFAFSNGWRDGFVIRSDSQQAELQTRFGGKTDSRIVPRSSLIIATDDAASLRKRNAAQLFKGNLKGEQRED